MTIPILDQLAPGSTGQGSLTPDLGLSVEVPCLAVRGARPGPTLLVTAGIHGAEYASIEAAYRVARTDAGALAGSLVVLPVACPPSFFARTIYVNPVDGANPNRVFPGRPDGTFAERLAHWLTTTFIHPADAYLDLHGGDMIESLAPFSIHDVGDEASRELADAFGLPLRVADDLPGTTITSASRDGVPSVIAEAGGQGLWPEDAVRPLVEGVQRSMQHLGMLAGQPAPRPVRQLTTFAWIRSEHAGLWRPAVAGGDEVAAGQEMGVVSDLLDVPVRRVVSPIDGVVLFAVSSLAMNVGDPLVGIGAD